jgi:hypothetical protein
VDATPGEVRAALVPDDAIRFEQQLRDALVRAADSLELTEVLQVLARWRRTAWLTTAKGHSGYRQLLADADRILSTGERPDGTVTWNDLRTRLGL